MRQGFFTALFALALTAGLTVGAAAASYTDVAAGAWYYDAVTKVTRDGLMNGTSETTFSPETPVTRGMVAAVLWRLAGSPAPAGLDRPIRSYCTALPAAFQPILPHPQKFFQKTAPAP